MDYLPHALSAVGTVTLAYNSLQLVSGLSPYFRPSGLPRYHHGQPGTKWALVTGASDGIGRGFVDNLLAQGFNVLMHGRNSSKLASIQEQLTAKHPNLDIRVVIADASAAHPDIDNIVAAVKRLPGKLTILINNVGGIPPDSTYQLLSNQNIDGVDEIVGINARFPVLVTRAVLPELQRNAPALVMNIGSGAGLLSLPYVATYSACKAFNHAFSRALGREMATAGTNVEVLGILIGEVESAGNALAKADLFTCSSDTLAKAALARVGCGRALVWAWYRHMLQYSVFALLPDFMVTRIAGSMMQQRRDETQQAKAKAT